MDPDIFHLMILLLASIQSCTGFGFHHYRTFQKDNNPKSISRPDRDIQNHFIQWKVYPHWGKRKRSGTSDDSEKVHRKSKRFFNAFFPWLVPAISKSISQDSNDVLSVQSRLASVVKKPFFLNALDSLPILYDYSMKDASLQPESINKSPRYLTELSDRSENTRKSQPFSMLSSKPSRNFDTTFSEAEFLPNEAFSNSDDRYRFDHSLTNGKQSIYIDNNLDLFQNDMPNQNTQMFRETKGEVNGERFDDILNTLESMKDGKTKSIDTNSLPGNMFQSDLSPIQLDISTKNSKNAFQNPITENGDDFFVVENGVMGTKHANGDDGSKLSSDKSYFVLQNSPVQNSMQNDISRFDSIELEMLGDRFQDDGTLPSSFTDLKGNPIDQNVLDILNDPNWDGKFGDLPAPEKIGAIKPGFYQSMSPGQWVNDKSKCTGVESRTCAIDAECSCNGLYQCINERCSTVSSSIDKQHFPDIPNESGDIFLWGEPIPTD